jgi:hypothetical protein
MDDLEAQDFGRLPYAVQVEWVLELRWLLDLLEVQWLKELAAVDARGAAGAEQGQPAASTAAWLRDRLHMDADAATTTPVPGECMGPHLSPAPNNSLAGTPWEGLAGGMSMVMFRVRARVEARRARAALPGRRVAGG